MEKMTNLNAKNLETFKSVIRVVSTFTRIKEKWDRETKVS